MEKKITIRISQEAFETLEQIKENEKFSSQGSVIEHLISSNKDVTKASSNSSTDFSEQVKILQSICKDTNKKAHVLLDLLNTFITYGIDVSPADFASHKNQPHNWVTQSEQKLSNEIYAKTRQKSLSSGHNE